MKQLNPNQLNRVIGGTQGSGGGDGVIPPKNDYLKSRSVETKGSGGGGGVIPPTAP